jgi:hypothetical protein
VAASLIGVGALVAAMLCVTWSSPHRAERRRSAASQTLNVTAATEHYDESQLSGLLLEIGAINPVEPPERCYPHPRGGLPLLIRLP